MSCDLLKWLLQQNLTASIRLYEMAPYTLHYLEGCIEQTNSQWLKYDPFVMSVHYAWWYKA